MANRFLMVILILIFAASGSLSCASPAQFKVLSLEVKPQELVASNPADITITVKNIGGSEGIYSALLSLNDTNIESQKVTVAAGDTKSIVVKHIENKPGTYSVKLDDLTSTFTVKAVQPVITVKEVTLKYDYGKARDAISAITGITTGYLVDFTPPSTPFTVKKMRILGGIFGSGWKGKKFEVQILDKDLKSLYKAEYPVELFPVANDVTDAVWIDLDVSGIKTDGQFYVHVYTGTGMREGIHIGADDSVPNEHSNVTMRGDSGDVKESWPYWNSFWFGDKKHVNWMIRVVGTYQSEQ